MKNKLGQLKTSFRKDFQNRFSNLEMSLNMSKERTSNQKKELIKAITKPIVDSLYKRATRSKGWAVSGPRRKILDLIKKTAENN